MPITSTIQAVGNWSVNLSPETPRSLVDILSSGYFGHIAIATGRHDPRVEGDSLLTSARYVGVLTGGTFNSAISGNGPQLSGDGMATWLATPSSVGDVIESPLSFTAATFATVINALLPAAVTAGTIHSIGSATYTGAFVWVDRRTALNTFCGLMSTGPAASQTVEWRVNGNASLDTGHVSDLYVTTPVTAIVARNAGIDMTVRGLPGVAQLIEDVKDFTTRVVVLAGGSGASTAVGVANITDVGGTNPYLDQHGNPIKMTRMVSASSVSSYNATAAAQTAILPYTLPRDQVRLTSQEYDITGELSVGDYTYVYDPDAGIVDTTQEVIFRGQRIEPALLRVIELTFPVTTGMTVAYRDKNGVWYDLTDFVIPETGDTTVVVGGYNRALVSTSEPVGGRPIPDTTIPGVPVFSPFTTTAYQGSSDGRTKAQIYASWSTPANTDGTTMTDLDHYEIQYRPDLGIYAINPSYNGLQSAGYTYNSLAALGGTYNKLIPQPLANWKVTFVAGGTNTLLIQELTPGVNYDFQIRAVDTAQPPNYGAWSATTTFQAQYDTIPPPTPDAPTVATNMASVQVTWDCGQAGGGTFNQAVDLHHVEVHGSYDPLFLPSNGTKLGNLPANIGNITGQIPVVGTFVIPPGQPPAQQRFIKLIAVDEAGNKSQPSAAVGSTATLWSDAYITSLSVSKLTAGTVTAAVILGSTISTATSGGRVTLDGSADAFEVYDTGGHQIAQWNPSGISWLNGPLLGSIKITTGPGSALSPFMTWDTGSGNSSSLPTLYAEGGVIGATNFADGFHIAGPQSTSALDSAQSGTSISLGASTSTDGASFSVGYNSNTAHIGGTTLLRANGWTVTAQQVVGGAGTTPTASNVLAGSVLQNDDAGLGTAPHFVHMEAVTVITDGSGNSVFNHNCSFTPTGGVVGFYTGGSGTGYQYAWNGAFTSSTGSINIKGPTGANITTATVNMYCIFWA